MQLCLTHSTQGLFYFAFNKKNQKFYANNQEIVLISQQQTKHFAKMMMYDCSDIHLQMTISLWSLIY